MKKTNLKVALGGVATGILLASAVYIIHFFLTVSRPPVAYYKPAEWKRLVAEKETSPRPAYFEKLKIAPDARTVEIRGPASKDH